VDYAGILRALTTAFLVFGGLTLAWAGMRRWKPAATAYATAVTAWWGTVLWTAEATNAGAFESGATAMPAPSATVVVFVLIGAVLAIVSRKGSRKSLASVFVWALIVAGMAVVLAAKGVFGGLGGVGVVLALVAGALLCFVALRKARPSDGEPPPGGSASTPVPPLRPPGSGG